MSESKTFQSDEERLRELEERLEHHKRRFVSASQRGLHAAQRRLTPLRWVSDYPVQAVALALVGGLCLGLALPLDRRKGPSLGL